MTIRLFVLYRVAARYGLPVVPEWAPWLCASSVNEKQSALDGTGMLACAGERD